jgi:hypothetical protein
MKSWRAPRAERLGQNEVEGKNCVSIGFRHLVAKADYTLSETILTVQYFVLVGGVGQSRGYGNCFSALGGDGASEWTLRWRLGKQLAGSWHWCFGNSFFLPPKGTPYACYQLLGRG